MKDKTLVVDHLNEFNILINKLSLVEVKIEEEDKATTLLCLLPEIWDQLMMMLNNADPSGTLIYDDVVVALLQEESRRKTSQSGSSSDALFVRGRITKRNQSSRSHSRSKSKMQRRGKCWHCEKSTSQEGL